MHKLLAAIITVFTCSVVMAQDCNCKSEFLWVKGFMEKNHPGFNSDIKSPDEAAYKKFTDRLLKTIEEDKEGKYCIVYLKQYIAYLQDHHSSINGISYPVNENNGDSLRAFLQSPLFINTERIAVDSAAWLTRFSKLDPAAIEGIYSTPDSVYTIAVINSPTKHRDFVGVILSSKTKTWERGQVKIEIQAEGESSNVAYLYMRNHSLNYQQWHRASGQSPIPGWVKIYPKLDTKTGQRISSELVSFAPLDSVTALVSIRSFGGQFSRSLDSAYKKIVPELRKFPKLIIDVRNNGGGSDNNYSSLMPLIYTDTIYDDFVEMFITEDNKKAYEKMRDEAKANPERWGTMGYMSWQFRLNQMKDQPMNSFIAISAKNSKTTYRKEGGNPQKIAILYNRNCASSCEQLLIDASYSKKIILVGENSGGYIAYGNVMSIKTPCGNSLNWTTTRKNKDRKYEFVGIEPQYKIPIQESDWVEYTRRLLHK